MAPMIRTDGPSGPGRLASVAVAVLLAATAGLAFDRVFALRDLIPVVAVAAIVPALSSFGLARLVPLWCSLTAGVLAWMIVVSATLFRADALAGFLPSPDSLRGAVFGLRDSWKAILTTILPTAATPQPLVLVHGLVWLAAMVGTELALRTTTRVAPAVPAAGVLGVAVVLGVGGAGSGFPWPVALVALTLLLALVRAPWSVRVIAVGVPTLACLTLVAAIAGPAIPVAAKPYDVRRFVTPPPPQPMKGISPLDYVSSWLQNPRRVMFTAQTSAATSSAERPNWRLAVLDRFDGATWSSTGGFLPSTGRVPPPDPPGARDVVEQRVTLGNLPGGWLPAADRPESVSGTKVVVDPRTGVLTSAAPLSEGMTYSVTSGIRRYSADELRHAVPTRNALALDLPDTPDGRTSPQLTTFRNLAQKATSGASTPMRQAVLLAAYLRGHAIYDVTAPPGHSYRNLEFFLKEARRGTTEQFATAFAVMARTLGLPSRVVVGFQPASADGARQQPVLAGDVLVWAEIEFAGPGWVPFYPTPTRGKSRGGNDVAEGVSKERQEIEKEIGSADAETTKVEPAHPSPSSTKPAPGPASRGDAVAWPLVGGAVAGGIPVAYLLAVLIVPAWRRVRRKHGRTPEARIAGAWRQTTTRLRDVGILPDRSLTAHEVAGFGTRALADPAADDHLRPLADLVNQARFDPVGPEEAAAAVAWRHSEAVAVMVRRKVGLPRRIRNRLSPRSLGR
jgi:transglutaminase-like putative cysteine protease